MTGKHFCSLKKFMAQWLNFFMIGVAGSKVSKKSGSTPAQKVCQNCPCLFKQMDHKGVIGGNRPITPDIVILIFQDNNKRVGRPWPIHHRTWGDLRASPSSGTHPASGSRSTEIQLLWANQSTRTMRGRKTTQASIRIIMICYYSEEGNKMGGPFLFWLHNMQSMAKKRNNNNNLGGRSPAHPSGKRIPERDVVKYLVSKYWGSLQSMTVVYTLSWLTAINQKELIPSREQQGEADWTAWVAQGHPAGFCISKRNGGKKRENSGRGAHRGTHSS